jgi:CheY-like chemotaxis protein
MAAPPKPAGGGFGRPAAPAAAPPVRPPEPTSGVVAVLDQDGAWNGIDLGAVVSIVATDEAVRKLATDWPGTVLANLAAPGVVKALVTMRSMHAPSRIIGFLATGADRALALGAVEPASLPLAPDAIVAALARHAPAKARVVTVGADVDALLSLRQALARAGTSVSLAWDGKQATDLLDMVHPHAVVADLGAPYDACAVLGRLAASSPIPAAVLIEGNADASAALAMVLNNPDVADKVVTRKDLLALLGRSAAAKSPALRPSSAGAAAVGVRR